MFYCQITRKVLVFLLFNSDSSVRQVIKVNIADTKCASLRLERCCVNHATVFV